MNTAIGGIDHGGAGEHAPATPWADLRGLWNWAVPAAIQTAWLVPWVAAVVTVAAHVSPALRLVAGNSIITGLVAAAVSWLAMIVVDASFATAKSANTRMYGELTSQIEALRAEHRRLSATLRDFDADAAAACHEAHTEIEAVSGQLDASGLGWVLGYGYLNAWTGIHRVTEILLGAMGRDELRAEAQYERFRIEGSRIPAGQQKKLLDQVEAVSGALDRPRKDPRTGDYEDPLPESRAVLRAVRSAVDSFRDSSWAGLLQARNRTLALLLLSQITLYGILSVAIELGATAPQVASGALFFLTGAALGLFHLLYQQPLTTEDVADYGLSLARLRTLPVYCGLAGVAGVVLYALLFSGFSLSGSTDITQAAAAKLGAMFTLQTDPTGLLVAAVFGLTPNLLTSRLVKLSDEYKDAIKSTTATNGA